MLTSIDGKEVEMPNRDQLADGAFQRLRYTMQSVSDAESLQRVFPNPPVPGTRLAYKWGKLGASDIMEVFVEPDPNAPAAKPTEDGDAPVDTAETLEKLTKAELLTKAATLGIEDAKESDNKATLIAKILEKLTDPAGDAPQA